MNRINTINLIQNGQADTYFIKDAKTSNLADTLQETNSEASTKLQELIDSKNSNNGVIGLDGNTIIPIFTIPEEIKPIDTLANVNSSFTSNIAYDFFANHSDSEGWLNDILDSTIDTGITSDLKFSCIDSNNNFFIGCKIENEKDYLVYKSNNGIEWSPIMVPVAEPSYVKYAKGIWMIGGNKQICYSTDATNWVLASLPETFDGIVTNIYYNYVVDGYNVWIVKTTTNLYSSLDHINWRVCTINNEPITFDIDNCCSIGRALFIAKKLDDTTNTSPQLIFQASFPDFIEFSHWVSPTYKATETPRHFHVTSTFNSLICCDSNVQKGIRLAIYSRGSDYIKSTYISHNAYGKLYFIDGIVFTTRLMQDQNSTKIVEYSLDGGYYWQNFPFRYMNDECKFYSANGTVLYTDGTSIYKIIKRDTDLNFNLLYTATTPITNFNMIYGNGTWLLYGDNGMIIFRGNYGNR